VGEKTKTHLDIRNAGEEGKENLKNKDGDLGVQGAGENGLASTI